MMEKREYKVSFLNPAFLGDAAQSGAWRTPPFKALLRQWWRVAYAADAQFEVNVDRLRQDEGDLFGSAAHKTGRRSRVRLRLDRWERGTLTRWQPLDKVTHPEVSFPVDSGLYLGYGPVEMPRGQRQPVLKNNRAAIQAGETAVLRLAFPGEDSRLIDTALSLMAWYGTVGGRSRNGWGSFALDPLEPAPPLQFNPPLRPWFDAIDLDWPHAIGRDDAGPLVWQTEACDDWQSLMRRLAEIKIALRTQFTFPNSKPPHAHPLERHWLSYPVTKHVVKAWGKNRRLPNSLRFKVRRHQDGTLVGAIFHVPCLPPSAFRPDRRVIERVWQQVHRHLDGAGLQRIPA